jgi:Protein of unknown function (DUF3179)
MIETLLLTTALFVPQEAKPPAKPPARPIAKPQSRPTSRPATKIPEKRPTDRERLRRADWGNDAPGRAVMRQKFLPITNAKYATADKVSERVADTDLVIGLVVGGKAVAYPINMLGGPQREIINEEYAGVRFCVNW